jgi:hypothetical protein
LSTIGISTFLGIREFKKERVKPTEVIVANITSTQGEIYWKSKDNTNYIVEYTQNSSNKTDILLQPTPITKDSTTGESIYSVKITNLNPNTKYLFSIKTDKFSWNQTSSFKTKENIKVLNLPRFLKGESQPNQLVLVKVDNGTDIINYIKDTQEHGTWLIEKPIGDYSLLTYATYSPRDSSKEENNTKLGLNPSPAYAQNNTTSTDLNNIASLELERGTTFVQIPIFLNSQSEQIHSAKELIQFSNNTILSIGLFRNDTWEKILINEDGKIYGEDFNLITGEACMFTTEKDINLPIIKDTYSLQLDIESLRGWNLVPTSVFNYFPLTTRDILLDEKHYSISQTATWEKNQSLFDYTIESTSSQIIGESIPLSLDKGLFVKIPY